MTENSRDVIVIGKKSPMSDVTTAIDQLSSFPLLTKKAREMSVGLAVDVTQVLLKKVKIFEIRCMRMDSESQDDKKRNVSTIEISISRIGA